MSYFEQIIFPPLPKVISSYVEEEEIIPFGRDLGDILDLKYWFEYLPTSIRFMVRCPTCNKIYCYSTLGIHAKPYMIEEGIKDTPKFFIGEWKENCPDASIHSEISNIFQGCI